LVCSEKVFLAIKSFNVRIIYFDIQKHLFEASVRDITFSCLYISSSIAELFQGYLMYLQKQATLIHILHDELAVTVDGAISTVYLTGTSGS
jgi:hypothetical protein